jgi:hypothetical protein
MSSDLAASSEAEVRCNSIFRVAFSVTEVFNSFRKAVVVAETSSNLLDRAEMRLLDSKYGTAASGVKNSANTVKWVMAGYLWRKLARASCAAFVGVVEVLVSVFSGGLVTISEEPNRIQ